MEDVVNVQGRDTRREARRDHRSGTSAWFLEREPTVRTKRGYGPKASEW